MMSFSLSQLWTFGIKLYRQESEAVPLGSDRYEIKGALYLQTKPLTWDGIIGANTSIDVIIEYSILYISGPHAVERTQTYMMGKGYIKTERYS